ncbi:uncharacterized protein PHACADRAFT_194904 [Phanerochaete carnosa HHB-10118-sp]|uniref:C2H2-type domain-containing protein n=1 Tax=Phanerochaete carnosa (strain HHB-10118-sp) TaxID=650164 RepID=K5X3I2_PHACS|nr:uncharacterized protein PHACADRAFT_194904 [Phanerochaete carnosa HHB-10118-sp]EKM57347.1 hypothetical protein PHACADRAFT_194904 [Phanerochaete carnosa HHB-10118-sp]
MPRRTQNKTAVQLFCNFCNRTFTSKIGLKSHVRQSPRCHEDLDRRTREVCENSFAPDLLSSTPNDLSTTLNGDGEATGTLPESLPEQEPSAKHARVEEINDDDDLEAGGHPKRPFIDYSARFKVKIKKKGLTLFESMHADQMRKDNPWAPFEDEEEWELAHWLTTHGLSQGAIDEYLKLPITRERTKVSYKNKQSLRKKIEQLPKGPGGTCEMFTTKGDVVDPKNGQRKVQTFELWKRDPVECIKELLSNPLFHEHLRYAPEPQYEDAEGAKPVINEMWTAEWWPQIQERLPPGAVVAPVILSSDKTQLSAFSGDKTAWPVYLSLGNISKDLRRSPSSHAMILIGYLPVAKLACFSKEKRPRASYQLFHDCMRSLLRPWVVRTVHPILAAYITDHPEQCLLTCVKENRCPKCLVRSEDCGTGLGKHVRWRDHKQTAKKLKRAAAGEKTADFREDGLRPVNPLWANLPHADIFVCITPDILHQLHKGMFKEHVVKWASACIPDSGDDEVDARFKCMPAHPELRHFREEISLVSQWTGTEYKNMEKVFLGVIAGAVPKEVILAIRGLLDFIYYAHFESHTSTSLTCLDAAWCQFHKYKSAFRTHYALAKEMLKNWANFNGIPKLHAMDHYLRSIQLLGAADGYNTEGTERLHINFSKHGYRAGNNKKYIRQMTEWLDRQEAVHRFHAYLQWRRPAPKKGPQLERVLHEREKLQKKLDEPGAEEPTLPAGEKQEEQESRGLRSRDGTQISYRIAKKPAHPHVKAVEAAERFGATDLSWYLEDFLRDAATFAPTAVAQSVPKLSELSRNTCIDVYKQVRFDLPVMTQVSRHAVSDVVQAVPAQKTLMSGVEIESTLAHFSTVLAYRNAHRLEGSRVNGSERAADVQDHLAVGRVRVIFRAPDAWSKLAPHPLVYVEWFTSLNAFDEDLDTGAFVASL